MTKARAALILAFISLAAMGAIQIAAAEPQTVLRHPVEIAKGRHLNLVCMGRGQPTVVFENGLGSSILDWKEVQTAVAGFTRACVYDRAGKGYSDPAGATSHAATVVADLHSLIGKSGMATPVVLVGQSAGGLFATLYAETFPSQVSGLVLVDPSFAHQFRDWTARYPEERVRTVAAIKGSNAFLAKCAGLAHAKRLSVGDPSHCTDFAGMSPEATYAADERAYFAAQVLNPAYYEAIILEQRAMIPLDQDTDQNSLDADRGSRPLGSLPLAVLTSGMKGLNGSSPTPEEEAQWKAFWKAGHDRLAAKSTRGESIDVPDAGHLIQKDRPQAVIDAIRRTVQAARANTRS